MEEKENHLLSGTRLSGYAFSSMVFLYVVISLVLSSILELLKVESGSVMYFSIRAFFSVLSIVIIIILINRRRRGSIMLTTYAKKFNPLYLILSVGLAVGLFLGFGFINIKIEGFIESVGGKTASLDLPLDSPLHLILFILLYALLPAFEEELFFRGLIFENLMESKKLILSAIISSLCFALYHTSLTQFAYQFIYGFFLCLLCFCAKSSIPGIVTHFLNNAFIIICTYFNIDIDLLSISNILLGLLVLVICVFVIFLLIKRSNGKKEGNTDEKIIDFFFPFGIVGITFCVFLAILGAFL